jgi:hypothetical protein
MPSKATQRPHSPILSFLYRFIERLLCTTIRMAGREAKLSAMVLPGRIELTTSPLPGHQMYR